MWADPDADYDKIGKEQASLEDKIDAADAWSLERNVEIAMDALRCPPDDSPVTNLSGGEKRRVALCRLLLSQSRPAAARRADQPPRRRVGVLAGAIPAGLPRHGRGDHPRSLLPRQRGAAGSSSSTAARASRSRATTRAGWSRSRSGWPSRRSRTSLVAAHSNASSNGFACRPRPARPRARPASPPTTSCRPRPRPSATPATSWRSRSRPASGSATP